MADTSIMVIPSTMTAPVLFSPGKADQVIEEIKAVARKEAAQLEISTAEGREKIASLAYKIARTKTATDKMRLELVADRKKELKLIDAEGARIWDELEALQKEIRQPLTEWENRDKERIARHQTALAELETAGTHTANEWQSLSVNAMKDRMREIEESYPESHDWEEFASRGRLAVKTTKRVIADAIAKREKYDSDQAELARLRAEAAERAQKEREEAAAAKAKQERIRREKERAEEEERLRAENRKHAAKINGEAKASLLNHTNLTAENAEEVVRAIARGLVSHVSIRY